MVSRVTRFCTPKTFGDGLVLVRRLNMSVRISRAKWPPHTLDEARLTLSQKKPDQDELQQASSRVQQFFQLPSGESVRDCKYRVLASCLMLNEVWSCSMKGASNGKMYLTRRYLCWLGKSGFKKVSVRSPNSVLCAYCVKKIWSVPELRDLRVDGKVLVLAWITSNTVIDTVWLPDWSSLLISLDYLSLFWRGHGDAIAQDDPPCFLWDQWKRYNPLRRWRVGWGEGETSVGYVFDWFGYNSNVKSMTSPNYTRWTETIKRHSFLPAPKIIDIWSACSSLITRRTGCSYVWPNHLRNKERVDINQSIKGYHLLHAICRFPNLDSAILTDILEFPGITVTAEIDYDKTTPLHYFCENSQSLDCVKLGYVRPKPSWLSLVNYSSSWEQILMRSRNRAKRHCTKLSLTRR